MSEKATQREKILRRLQQGPATTFELIMLGMCCPTKRISELRREGQQITTTERYRGKTRIVTYKLEGKAE